MRFLRQNTAVIITVGPFYDKTDGVTTKTALTISNERITLTADTDDNAAPTNILDNVTGATSGTSNDLNYITGNDAGMMQLELSAANTNRVGRMYLSITDAANHCPVFHEFEVLPAMVYDSLIAGTDRFDANVTHVADTAQTAGDVTALINTLDDFVDTEVAAIKAKTDNLPSDPADASDVAAAFTALTTKVEGSGIKKNASLNNFVFIMTDATTGAGKTGLSSFTKEYSIDGGAFNPLTNAVAEIANGAYKIDLTSGELNGNLIILRFAASGANDTLLVIKTIA